MAIEHTAKEWALFLATFVGWEWLLGALFLSYYLLATTYYFIRNAQFLRELWLRWRTRARQPERIAPP